MKLLALLFAVPAIVISPVKVEAAGKPLAISLSPATQIVTEGGAATLLLGKSGGNGKLAAARVTTSDGSFTASVVPGASFAVQVPDNQVVDGERDVTVTAVASTGATARATIHVLDNDVPPAVTWTVCAPENGTCSVVGTANVRYGANGAFVTRSVTGTIGCDNATFGDPLVGTVKACETDGTVALPVVAPPIVTPPPDPLKGEAEIADNFDASKGIGPAEWQINGVPQVAPPSKEEVGAFRFYCSPGQLLKDDPLVYPGQPGASHLHQFVGNTGTNASSTYQSLRTTGGTNCGIPGAPINRSAYWIPAVFDGAGSAVKPDYSLIYYKREPASSPQCTDPVAKRGICTDLANGIRFVFGYNMKTGTNGPTDINAPEYWNIAFFCWGSDDGTVGDGGATARYRTIKDVVDAGCPVGAQLIITGFAPNCWDGKTLDAADHRSNVVYAAKLDAGQGIRCDDAHPYLIPDMQFQWHYTVDANFAAGKWHLSSDEMVPGAVAGSTMHMDYWEAWSPTVKATWEKNCINGHLTCSSGDLGDATQMIGAGMPFPGGFPKHQLVPAP